MRGHLAILLLCCIPARAIWAQVDQTVAVRDGVPGGDIFSTPADMQLVPKAPGAHPGEVWVRSTNEGLQLWGKVQLNGDSLYWPVEKSGVPQSDHVEIWLSAAPGVDMPAIGYGNQFDQIPLKSSGDCIVPGEKRDREAECLRWFKDQGQYRKIFEKLFTRHWVATKAPDGMSGLFEDYATSAWADLRRSYFEEELPKPLEPHGTDGMVSEFGEISKNTVITNARGKEEDATIDAAYTFHFFIPWSAFPPTQELSLRDLWLTVDVFRGTLTGKQAGAVSTTSASAQRIAGKPSSFNHLVLNLPREHQITPCRATGAEKDLYGTSHRAWFFPMAGKGPQTLTTDYDIENPAAWDMYYPIGLSPAFRATEHFWKELPDGATICGPQLTYLNRGVANDSAFKVAPKYLETKTLADGWMLVRTGPDVSKTSSFGPGMCARCPVSDLHIYSVSPEGQIAPALDLKKAWGTGKVIRGDFDIAPDWSKITAYEPYITIGEDGRGGKKDAWTATSYCLTEHTYQKCGEEKSAKPPDPPKFNLSGDL